MRREIEQTVAQLDGLEELIASPQDRQELANARKWLAAGGLSVYSNQDFDVLQSVNGVLARVNGLCTCDYCGLVPATGYVASYRAHVCEPCYADHHGPVCE